MEWLEDRLAPALFLVTNTLDSGAGSLRQAIVNANSTAGDDNVLFDPGLFSLNVKSTITLQTSLPELATNIDIEGPGANVLTVARSTAAGTPDFGIFQVATGATVTMAGLTVSNGRAAAGGGILNLGTLTVRDCLISNNTATQVGGGIANDRFPAMGNPSLTVINSTISNNTTAAAGQGAGGINSESGTVLIENSTISGNRALESLVTGGVGIYGGTTTIRSSTITGNSFTPGLQQNNNGGGLDAYGEVRLLNTIIAGNTGGNGGDFQGSVTSLGNNLIGNLGGTYPGQGIINGVNGDKVSSNYLLGPLQDNGGPIPTHTLLTGSVAIDAGNAGGTTQDQRGAARPADGDGNTVKVADIGAYELTAAGTADLAVSLRAPRNPINKTDTPVYYFSVRNLGLLAANNVSFTLALANVTFYQTGAQLAGPAFSISTPNTHTVTGTINSLAAGTEATFAVKVTVDPNIANSSSFTATLTVTSDTTDPATGNNTATAEVALPRTVFQFSAASFNAPESGPTATITVTRTVITDVASSVQYATSNGTALVNQDYQSSSGTLNFAAGETSKTFNVTLINDVAIENDETVNLTLSNPSSGSILGSQNTAVLVIQDDEPLNPLFGSNGKAQTDFFGSLDNTAADVAVAADGKTVVLGKTGSQISLTRYNLDGSLDTTFGTNGTVFSNWGSQYAQPARLAFQADGKIVAVGMGGASENSIVAARFNVNVPGKPDGSPDTSFGTNGLVFTSMGSDTTDAANAVAFQADGKIVVAGWSMSYQGASPSVSFAVVRYNTDGTLDASFDGDGKLMTSFSGLSATANGVLVRNNQILVVGTLSTDTTGGYSPGDIGLVRYNSNGSLDTSFGNQGLVQTHLQEGDVQVVGLAVQSNGRIIVAGELGAAPNLSYALVGYTSTGALADNSTPSPFGTSGTGRVVTQFPGQYARLGALTLQSDNQIILGGTLDKQFLARRYDSNGGTGTVFTGSSLTNVDGSWVALGSGGTVVLAGSVIGSNNNQDYALVRFRTDGFLDTTFGGTGSLVTDISGSPDDTASAVAIQTDGKILVAGTTFLGLTPPRLALARYTTLGVLDPTFHGNGQLTTAFTGGSFDAKAVTQQADGKILVAGTFNGNFAVARFTASGDSDNTFGSAGLATTNFPNYGSASVRGLVVQSGGKIVLFGSANASLGSDFALARFTSLGILDTTFGTGGRVTTDFNNSSNDQAYAALLQQGAILVVGSTGTTTGGTDFALARYTADGAPDTTFNGTGRVTTHFASPWGSGYAQAKAVALQDNKIVVGGEINGAFGLTRYEAGGSLDNTFNTNGQVTTSIFGSVSGLVVLPSTKQIVLVGTSYDYSSSQTDTRLELMRFNTNGSLDDTFVRQGLASPPLGVPINVMGAALALDNSLIVVGASGLTGNRDFLTTQSFMGSAQLSSSNYLVNEQAGSASITLTRSGDTSGTVRVQFATSDGTATAGSDYTAVNTTLTFNPGQTTQTVSIPILYNSAVEGSETVNLILSNPTGNADLGFINRGVLTITETTPAQIQFSAAAFIGREGRAAAITVTRSNNTTDPVSVQFATSDGTATAGSDYTAVNTTVTFDQAGVTSKTVLVPILKDALADGNETVNLALSNLTGNALFGPNQNAVLTLSDIPGLLVFDDFNRAGPTLGTDWTILSGGAMTIQSNHLTTGTPAASFALSNAAGTQSNVSVEANLFLDQTGLQYSGLLARATDASNMYVGEFVGYQGAYAGYIFRVQGGAWTLLKYGTVQASAILHGGQDLLTFQVVGNSLKLFLNDQLVAYAFDSALGSGKTGLWGGPGVSLDDFTVATANPLTATLPFQDNFNQSSYDPQLSRSWTEQIGNFGVASNRLQADTSIFSLATLNQASVADVSVQANIAVQTGSGLQYGGLVTRFTNLSNMYYGEFVAYNGAYAGYLYSAKAGNYQMMSFASINPSAVKGDGNDVLRFEAVGSSLKLFFNDQLVTYAYDTGLTSGAAGLWGGYEKSLGTPHNCVLDNFSATAIALNNVALPFTEAFGQGTALSRSWTERAGSFSINAQQQLQADNSALSLATVNHPATANLSVQANLILKNNAPGKTSLEYGGLVARVVDGNNLYVAEFVSYYDGSQYAYAGYIFLVKGGAWSLLKYGTVADPNSVKRDGTDLLKFDTNGTTLTLSLNGQQLASTNDTTLSSGVSGVWGGPGFGLDNFFIQNI